MITAGIPRVLEKVLTKQICFISLNFQLQLVQFVYLFIISNISLNMACNEFLTFKLSQPK